MSMAPDSDLKCTHVKTLEVSNNIGYYAGNFVADFK